MLVGPAEELTQGVSPLEDQMGVMLPGDRNTAVQLDRLASNLVECI